ncbi:MAG: metallophosphoesterase family protein [Polyangiaceae bacterium]|nr:metallophosphoesterase family protein [Polyangiaceae bacterium]
MRKSVRGSGTPLREERAVVPVRPDGGVRLAVVADTHSAPHEEGLRHLAALRPDAIVHGGDIGDLSVLDALAEIAPTHAVRGNIDTRAAQIPDVLTLDLENAGERVLRILLMHIAVFGPRLRADAVRLAQQHGANMVVCGHSHVPFIGRDKGLSMFNPGSIGPRRFGLPIVFGVLELADNKLRMHHVDCETGQRWMP